MSIKKLIRTILGLVLALSFTAALPINATAINMIKVQLDGHELSFDVTPQLINGRTMVPMRTIFEAMGAAITWDGVSQTVTAKKDSTQIRLTVGSNMAYKNGESISLDAAPINSSGRVLVPVRFIAESMGADVSWDAATQIVNISSGASVAYDLKSYTGSFKIIERTNNSSFTVKFVDATHLSFEHEVVEGNRMYSLTNWEAMTVPFSNGSGQGSIKSNDLGLITFTITLKPNGGFIFQSDDKWNVVNGTYKTAEEMTQAEKDSLSSLQAQEKSALEKEVFTWLTQASGHWYRESSEVPARSSASVEFRADGSVEYWSNDGSGYHTSTHKGQFVLDGNTLSFNNEVYLVRMFTSDSKKVISLDGNSEFGGSYTLLPDYKFE